MSSQTPEDNSTPPQSKSRQERIRDNQRRSRARRQEYLADLERRLTDCQSTCRDADIQKAAFLELQIENARLRELLALAGINEQFVDHYVAQAAARVDQSSREANSALRQIKPKMPLTTMNPNRETGSNLQPRMGQLMGPGNVSTLITPTANLSTSDKLSPSSNYLSANPFLIPTSQGMGSSTFDWLYQQEDSSSHPSQHSCIFSCDTFCVPSTNDSMVTDNAVLCSVAKHMIDQYHISPAEMGEVKAKLATGFQKPAYPGTGCAVNSQTLFQVLNELSTRYG